MKNAKFKKIIEIVCRALCFVLPIIVGIFDNKKQAEQIKEAVSSYMEERGLLS